MNATNKQPALRPIPPISADGATVGADDNSHAAGAILSLRHGGTDVLYVHRAEEVLAACTPLPERLLLGCARQTAQDQRKSALARAIVHALIAVLPILLVMGWLREASGSRSVTLTGFALAMLGVMGRAVWLEMRTPGKVWQLTEWLDFTTRTWHARKAYPDGSLPTHSARLPLDQLVLVCIQHHWEQGVTHDLALCRADELKALKKYDEAPHLNMIHQAENEEDSIAFARQLSQCWQIPAYRHAFDAGADRYRLFGLDEPPSNSRLRKKKPAA